MDHLGASTSTPPDPASSEMPTAGASRVRSTRDAKGPADPPQLAIKVSLPQEEPEIPAQEIARMPDHERPGAKRAIGQGHRFEARRLYRLARRKGQGDIFLAGAGCLDPARGICDEQARDVREARHTRDTVQLRFVGSIAEAAHRRSERFQAAHVHRGIAPDAALEIRLAQVVASP